METLDYDNLNLKTKINRDERGDFLLALTFTQKKQSKYAQAESILTSPETEYHSHLHDFLAACYDICRKTYSHFTSSKKQQPGRELPTKRLYGYLNHVLSLLFTDEYGNFREGILERINDDIAAYAKEFQDIASLHFHHIYRKLQHRNGYAAPYYDIAV